MAEKRFPEEEGRLGQQAAVLVDDIFRQLSNHGKEIVRKKAKDAGISFDESFDQYQIQDDRPAIPLS